MRNIDQRNVFEGLLIEVNLLLLAFGVRNHLSAHINIIGLVKNIDSAIMSQISKIDFFVRSKAKSDYSLCFFSSQSWNSSHQLFWLMMTSIDSRRNRSVLKHLFDILHGISTIVGRNGPRLPNRINMSEISHRRNRHFIDFLKDPIHFLIGGEVSGHIECFEESGVVGPSTETSLNEFF